MSDSPLYYITCGLGFKDGGPWCLGLSKQDIDLFELSFLMEPVITQSCFILFDLSLELETEKLNTVHVILACASQKIHFDMILIGLMIQVPIG